MRIGCLHRVRWRCSPASFAGVSLKIDIRAWFGERIVGLLHPIGQVECGKPMRACRVNLRMLRLDWEPEFGAVVDSSAV
jgi:hypothetical protein